MQSFWNRWKLHGENICCSIKIHDIMWRYDQFPMRKSNLKNKNFMTFENKIKIKKHMKWLTGDKIVKDKKGKVKKKV